jgi:hypothetical protein
MNEDNPTGEVEIKQQFTYFMPSKVDTDEDLIEDASDANGMETSYNRVTIGLIYDGMLNKNRKNFSDQIYASINKSTLVYLGLKHFKKLCINKITPTDMTYVVVPPLTTVSEYLNYIDSLKDIYKYGYRFFNDFNCTYFLNEKGVYAPDGSGDYNTVTIDIEKSTSVVTANPGMTIDKKNKLYLIYCNADDTTFDRDTKLAKQTSNIVGVDKNGNTTDVSVTDSSTSENEKTTYVRTRDSEARIKFKMMKYNTTISVSKNLVTGRYFTPNKIYMVKNYKSNSDYDGRYVLSRKQVVFQIEDGDFVPTTSLYLRLIVDFKSLTE